MTVLNASQLRTRVILLFILTIIVIGLIVSAVAFGMLLRTHMEVSAEKHKQHLKSKQKAMGNCLEHLSEQSTRIHSCSLCCNMLEDYNNNLLSLEDLREDNTQNLSRALEESKIIVGIIRTDLKGNIIASVGSVSPHASWPYIPGDNSATGESPQKVVFSKTISDLGTLRLVAVSPIEIDGDILGYDILFFSPEDFLENLQDPSVKATALFPQNRESVIVWADDTYSDSANKNPPEVHARVKQIIRALEPPSDINSVQKWPQTSNGEQFQFIYGRIPGSEWYVGSYIEEKITFGNMLRRHISILGVIFGLGCAGGALCYLALRPLTRGFVNLTARLERTNASLKEEISERRRMEADLRLSEEQWGQHLCLHRRCNLCSRRARAYKQAEQCRA